MNQRTSQQHIHLSLTSWQRSGFVHFLVDLVGDALFPSSRWPRHLFCQVLLLLTHWQWKLLRSLFPVVCSPAGPVRPHEYQAIMKEKHFLKHFSLMNNCCLNVLSLCFVIYDHPTFNLLEMSCTYKSCPLWV